jgi:heptosyltransferase-2
MREPRRLVVLAPNWLGDAVMALPAIADVRRAFPQARLDVAARRSVADVFRLTTSVDAVVTLAMDARWWRRAAFRTDAAALSSYDTAVLLPNSFGSAYVVKHAGVTERWGFASDARSRLLTRAIPRPTGARHQAEYYQELVRGLGINTGPLAVALDVPEAARINARDRLTRDGHVDGAPIVVLAPGAAYGKAKQWIPAHVARLITLIARERRATCVVVGSRADAATGAAIRAALPPLAPGRLVDLIGQTTLEALAGVLACADVCVCNDSGAMHLAAAVGAPVVAIFGPTNEHATAPLGNNGARAEILTHDVWCRPCMLRECPIDHRCMTGVTPERVLTAVTRLVSQRSGASPPDDSAA